MFKVWQENVFLGCYLLFFFSVPGSIAGMELAFFLLAVATLICKVVNGKLPEPIGGKRLWSLGFLLMGIIALSSFWHTGAVKDIVTDLGKAKFIFFGYLMSLSLPTVYKRLCGLKWVFLLHLSWIAIFGIYQGVTGVELVNWELKSLAPNGMRVKGFFSGTMTYSYVFSIWIVFLSGLLIKKNCLGNKIEKLLCLTVLIMGVSLIMTFTRGAWLSVLVALFSGFVVSLGWRKGLQLGIVALLLTSSFSFSEPVRERFLSIFNIENTSNNTRLELWKVHSQILRENVMLGVGISRKREVLNQKYQEGDFQYNFLGHAHNNFIEVFSSLGVIGGSVYLLFFGLLAWFLINEIFSRARRGYKSQVLIATLMAHIVFHFGGLTEATLLDQEIVYSFMFLSVLGLCFLTRRLEAED